MNSFPGNSQYILIKGIFLLSQLNIPEPHRATHVQPIPHEDLGGGTRTFAALQAAIEQQHTCNFTYKTKPRHAHPYRLIHKNGVWYLAAEEAGRLKNFSVALIEQLQVDSSAPFTPKRTHLDYIANKDDVWFTEQTTEVLLRIAPDIAHYFARRLTARPWARPATGSSAPSSAMPGPAAPRPARQTT